MVWRRTDLPLPTTPSAMSTTPICIRGLFEDAVTTSQSGDSITSIVLQLTTTPDEAWIEAFHHEWALTSYPRKRNARIGTVRVAGSAAVRRGLILFASPEDYVDKHKRYLEDAVARANDRVSQRARQRDVTLAEAAQQIRAINEAHYPAGEAPPPPTAEAPVIRLAV